MKPGEIESPCATGKREQGIYDKFIVRRTDGKSEPGEKHHGCRYFVLDLNHDPHALPALQAYADSCEQGGYLALAKDLRFMAATQGFGRSPDAPAAVPTSEGKEQPQQTTENEQAFVVSKHGKDVREAIEAYRSDEKRLRAPFSWPDDALSSKPWHYNFHCSWVSAWNESGREIDGHEFILQWMDGLNPDAEIIPCLLKVDPFCQCPKCVDAAAGPNATTEEQPIKPKEIGENSGGEA